MEDKFFTMINDKGEEIRYDVLFTFDSEDTNKSYIAYTDNTYDKEGNISVYASTYDKEDTEMKLGEIETEQEWKVIETILNTIQQELQKQQNNNEENEQ